MCASGPISNPVQPLMQAEGSNGQGASQWIKANGCPSAQASSSGGSVQADILMHNKRRPAMKNVLASCIQMDALAYYKLNPKFQLGTHCLSCHKKEKGKSKGNKGFQRTAEKKGIMRQIYKASWQRWQTPSIPATWYTQKVGWCQWTPWAWLPWSLFSKEI